MPVKNNKKVLQLLRISVVMTLFGLSTAQAAQPSVANEKLTFEQVIENILTTYPSLKITQLKVEQARYELVKVESQLGWTLSGNAGVSHDVSITGSPLDKGNLNAALEKKLKSGNSVSVSGNYSYEDNSFTLSPTFPNPSHSTSLDLNYRIPLSQGKENPSYTQGLISAESGFEIEKSTQLEIKDDIATQAMELFYAAAITQARIENATQGIQRAQRLKTYINNNFELGLTEEKDLLQVEAQLRAQITEKNRLQIAWLQQRTNLNRLMGRAWQAEFSPKFTIDDKQKIWDMPALINEVETYSPVLNRNEAILKQSEAEIAKSRDRHKDVFDVVLSAGTRTTSGNTVSGDVSEEELAGGVRFEYRESLDKRGLDAELAQAYLNRDVALEQIRLTKDDIKYSVPGLVAEIAAIQITLKTARSRLTAEQQKFNDALQRYKRGRTETDRLIQFENELHQVKLSVREQEIELSKKHTQLSLLRGLLWKNFSHYTN